MMVAIETLPPTDWQQLKTIRVLSVGDSPDAFGTTIAEVHAQPDSYWQQLAGALDGQRQALFFANDGASDEANAVGSAYARIDAEGFGHIGAMWVAPSHRGQGLARQLLGVGTNWLRERGVTVVRLWVTEGNQPATSLYLSSGFSFTGARESLRSDSPLMRVEMEQLVRA